MLTESILGYKSSWRILSLLLETPRKLVGRPELFEHTQLGNAPLSYGLNRLVRAGLIVKEKTGKKEFYCINLDNEEIKLVKELWEREKKKLRHLEYGVKIVISEFLRGVSELMEINKVILFGSHAKGTASVNSDIDLAVVFEKDLKPEIEVARVVKKLEKKFRSEIQIHYFTEKSFGRENRLVKEIKREGIKVWGK